MFVAILVLLNPNLVPTSLGFVAGGVCGSDDRLLESACNAADAGLRASDDEISARCFPLSIEDDGDVPGGSAFVSCRVALDVSSVISDVPCSDACSNTPWSSSHSFAVVTSDSTKQEPFTGLPATVGRVGFLLARSPARLNIPFKALSCPTTP